MVIIRNHSQTQGRHVHTTVHEFHHEELAGTRKQRRLLRLAFHKIHPQSLIPSKTTERLYRPYVTNARMKNIYSAAGIILSMQPIGTFSASQRINTGTSGRARGSCIGGCIHPHHTHRIVVSTRNASRRVTQFARLRGENGRVCVRVRPLLSLACCSSVAVAIVHATARFRIIRGLSLLTKRCTANMSRLSVSDTLRFRYNGRM